MSEGGSTEGDPPHSSRLPAARRPLPPPVEPPRGLRPAEEPDLPRPAGTADQQEERAAELARPVPQRQGRPKPPPVALLLLGGSGAFLLLVVAAAALGAAIGKHDDTAATPTRPGGTQAPASRGPDDRMARYGGLESNEIYRTQKMDSVGCTADLRSAAPARYERFVRRSTACLNRAWSAQLAERDIAHADPGLVISHSEQPASPCRSGSAGYTPVAFYCPANATMYYSLPAAASASMPADREYLISSSAHEYAHHVQQLTGISDAYTRRYNRAYPDVGRSTLLTRRLELQAQCFAGVFTSANASTMRVTRAAMATSAGRTGDDALGGSADDPSGNTHGSFASNRQWMVAHGWDERAPAACNTWTAEPAVVD